MAENVILFKTDDGQIKPDVKLDGETVWLTRGQMASLFERDIKTIGKHINNALNEELSSSAGRKICDNCRRRQNQTQAPFLIIKPLKKRRTSIKNTKLKH